MQETNSLCTDSRALRAEYSIVGISHNTAIWFRKYKDQSELKRRGTARLTISVEILSTAAQLF